MDEQPQPATDRNPEHEPDHGDQRRQAILQRIQSFRRFLLLLILCLSILAMILAGLILYLTYSNSGLFCPANIPVNIDETIALVEEAGHPTTYAAYAPPVPDGENAFSLILSALYLYSHDHDAATTVNAVIRGASLDVLLPEGNATASLGLWVENNAETLQVLHRAVRMPHLRRTLDPDTAFTDWGPDAASPFYPAYPLLARCALRASAGEADGAVADAVALARYSRLLLESPTTLGELTDGLMAASAVPAALRICSGLDGLSSQHRATLRRTAIPLADVSAHLGRGAQGHIVHLLTLTDRVPPSLLDQDFPIRLRQMVTALMQCARLGRTPFSEAEPQWEAAAMVYNGLSESPAMSDSILSGYLYTLNLPLAGHLASSMEVALQPFNH